MRILKKGYIGAGLVNDSLIIIALLTFASFARAHPVVLARGHVAADSAQLRWRGRRHARHVVPGRHAAGVGRRTIVGHGHRVDAVSDFWRQTAVYTIKLKRYNDRRDRFYNTNTILIATLITAIHGIVIVISCIMNHNNDNDVEGKRREQSLIS